MEDEDVTVGGGIKGPGTVNGKHGGDVVPEKLIVKDEDVAFVKDLIEEGGFVLSGAKGIAGAGDAVAADTGNGDDVEAVLVNTFGCDSGLIGGHDLDLMAMDFAEISSRGVDKSL